VTLRDGNSRVLKRLNYSFTPIDLFPHCRSIFLDWARVSRATHADPSRDLCARELWCDYRLEYLFVVSLTGS
jgi:hypothetical protein